MPTFHEVHFITNLIPTCFSERFPIYTPKEKKRARYRGEIKLIVKLILMMLMSILKTAKNLLRKILPQPRFEFGISCLAGADVSPIRSSRHMVMFIIITNVY